MPCPAGWRAGNAFTAPSEGAAAFPAGRAVPHRRRGVPGRMRWVSGRENAPGRRRRHKILHKQRQGHDCGHAPASACRKSLFAPLSQFSDLYKVLKTIDFNGAGHPSWVIYAPSAAALRRLRSETRLRAQSRAHPSLPPRKTHHFIDSLRQGHDCGHAPACFYPASSGITGIPRLYPCSFAAQADAPAA